MLLRESESAFIWWKYVLTVLVPFLSSAISCRIAEDLAMEVEAKAPLNVSQASREVLENIIIPRTPLVMEETNPDIIA
jgi:hypothetical protein